MPVPHGRDGRQADVDDAWAIACEIGLPVVVKPKDGNQGKGVTVNVTTREQLIAAYAAATEFGDDILLEKYIPGNDFRLLVIGGKLVAAARRDPLQVIGDGKHSVRELVEQVNLRSAPRHGPCHLIDQDPLRRHRLVQPGGAGIGCGNDSAQGSTRQAAQ